MTEDKKIIDQVVLAQDVSDKIKYEFFDYFLVKPLDPIKVTKEFSKPVATNTKTDENDITAQDFDKVETEVKEVDSDYRKGVIIKRPTYYDTMEETEHNIHVGDIVIFRDAAGFRFDLLKDSRLLRQYDILGVDRG